MGGGLMQLVAYGAQDVYLTGNPQITFFKVVYRRYTNFSVEPVQQVFNGAADFGRTVTCNINRNGDLITNMYVVVVLNDAVSKSDAKWAYVRRLGFALITETKIEIGGTKIDEQYGDWLNIWYELTHKVGLERGFKNMIGDTSDMTSMSLSKKGQTLYIPLAYWFNRNPGLALPLIALQYHDIRVTVQFRAGNGCVNYEYTANGQPPVSVSMQDAYLLIDYVYLDSEERKRFAQGQHEYLIEQVQFTGSESVTNLNSKYKLNFNHPSKFLLWATHLEKYNEPSKFISYAEDGDWKKATDRFAKVVWLASRADLSQNQTNDWILYFPNDNTEEDTAVSNMHQNLSTELAALAGKVSAQLMFSGAGHSALAMVDNVLLLSNDITSDDMSMTLEDIIGSGNNALSTQFLREHSVTVVDYFNYGTNLDRSNNPCNSAKLQLNGHDRFVERDGSYFNYVQTNQSFTNTPSDGINVYSFALKPEEHQPSGTCNFSRIDNATLNFSLKDNNNLGNNSIINIYTVNYNILRIMSGMGGLAYSN